MNIQEIKICCENLETWIIPKEYIKINSLCDFHYNYGRDGHLIHKLMLVINSDIMDLQSSYLSPLFERLLISPNISSVEIRFKDKQKNLLLSVPFRGSEEWNTLQESYINDNNDLVVIVSYL